MPIISEQGVVVLWWWWVVYCVGGWWNDLIFLQVVGFPFGKGAARWWKILATSRRFMQWERPLFWKKTKLEHAETEIDAV